MDDEFTRALERQARALERMADAMEALVAELRAQRQRPAARVKVVHQMDDAQRPVASYASGKTLKDPWAAHY